MILTEDDIVIACPYAALSGDIVGIYHLSDVVHTSGAASDADGGAARWQSPALHVRLHPTHREPANVFTAPSSGGSGHYDRGLDAQYARREVSVGRERPLRTLLACQVPRVATAQQGMSVRCNWNWNFIYFTNSYILLGK